MGWIKLTGKDGEAGRADVTIDSLDYGVSVFATRDITVPEREITMISVPGRNGDLSLDNGKWKNADVDFWCVAWTTLSSSGVPIHGVDKAVRFINAVAALRGYARIQTDAEDEYREGVFLGGVIVSRSEAERPGGMCKFKLRYSCKPQRYTVDGQVPVVIQANASRVITNPTPMVSYPLLRFNAPGSARVGVSSKITFSPGADGPSRVDVDVEIMEAYLLGQNCNKWVSAATSRRWFPLLPGDNTVYNDTAAPLAVTPRWWRL